MLTKIKSQWMVAALVALATQAVFAEKLYTTADLNVRTQAWGRVISTLPEGSQVTVLGDRGDFSKVRLPSGKIGYVHADYLSDGRTEAGHCDNCLNAALNDKISTASRNIKNAAQLAQGPQCVTNKLIEGAKKVVATNYGGRTRGGGKCALAVRQALNKSKIWPGGSLGNAKDMVPGLKAIGFTNIKTPGMTPANAPAGTVLVYGKALTKGCRGLGSVYGHVEIKENNDSFLYDAKVKFHIQEALGPKCRPLIAVMKMSSNCKTCSKEVKRTCGV